MGDFEVKYFLYTKRNCKEVIHRFRTFWAKKFILRFSYTGKYLIQKPEL